MPWPLAQCQPRKAAVLAAQAVLVLLGLVLARVRRVGRRQVLIALPPPLVLMFLLPTDSIHWAQGTVFQGSIDVSTSDANALDENYAVSNGQVTLNLQDLKPLDKDKTVNVYVDVGTVSVTLPDDVPVEMTAKDSVTLTTPSHKTYNESASGKKLTLNVQVNNGPVTIAE